MWSSEGHWRVEAWRRAILLMLATLQSDAAWDLCKRFEQSDFVQGECCREVDKIDWEQRHSCSQYRDEARLCEEFSSKFLLTDSHSGRTSAICQGLIPLENGVAKEVVTPRNGSKFSLPAWFDSWFDFRLEVTEDLGPLGLVTISATTVGNAELVADTTWFPKDRGAYRWAAEVSPTPSLRLTTSKMSESSEVHFIDCTPPCFVYISARARTPVHPISGDQKLEVIAVSETTRPISLRENSEVTQRLAQGEVQCFSYSPPVISRAALFTLVAKEGSAEMRVFVSPWLPRSLQDMSFATKWAADAILLPPDSPAFHRALEVAQRDNKSPQLYVHVRGTSKEPSMFSIVAREEGDAQIVHNGEEVKGAVLEGKYDYYRFYVDDNYSTQAPINVTVEILPVMGNPDLFISCHSTRPDEMHSDWGGKNVGLDAIFFTSLSHRFKAGWIYIAVGGDQFKGAYGLRVEWGASKLRLDDGQEEIGRVMKNDVRPYTLVVSEQQEHDHPIAIRAHAWVGVFNLCIVELQEDEDEVPSPEAEGVCKYSAIADSSKPPRAEPGSALAAIDIPAKDFKRGGKLALLLQGLNETNAFSIRALIDSPAVLTEGHNLIDALGPSCCVKGRSWEKLLKRRYRTFVRPVPGVEIQVRALWSEDDVSLAGATLRARHHHGGSAPGDDVESDAQPWLFEAHSSEGGDPTAPLRIVADLSRDSNGETVHADFWLEIELSVAKPVYFTMEIKTDGRHEVQRAQKQLIPGQRLPLTFSSLTMDSELVQFPLDPSSNDGDWQLQVRQCYGRVAVSLPYSQNFTVNGSGSDIDVPLPTGGLKKRNSGSINAAGDAIFKPLTELPVLYEMLLKPPGTGAHESPIFFKEDPVIKHELSHQFGFSFPAAKINSTRLHSDGMLAEHDEAALFYTLVAIPSNLTKLNANSTCGLKEAIKRQEAITVKITQGSTLGLRRLAAEFNGSAFKDEEYKINVLVKLVGQNGVTLAARCYAPYVFDKRKMVMSPVGQNKAVAGFVLIGLFAACNWISRRNPGSARKVRAKESVEMGEPYELQEDFYGERSNLRVSSRGRGKYVPPEMGQLTSALTDP